MSIYIRNFNGGFQSVHERIALFVRPNLPREFDIIASRGTRQP